MLVNPALTGLLGWPDPSALVGRPLLDLVRPTDAAAVQDRLDRTLAGQQVEPSPVPVLRADGTHVLVEGNPMRIRFDGEPALLLDVRDLSEIPDRSFDATVAFGGPISYAFEQAERALSECLRVTRVGGMVLASVMATVGTMRFFLPVVVEESRQYGMEVTDAVLRTGDLRHTPADAHRCRMFRWGEILAMIDALPCRLLAASASNATSLGHAAALEWFAAEPGRWQRYLDWEEELAQEPGALDGGTHILFAVESLDGAERSGDVVVSAPEAGELRPRGTG
ncbi:MAG: PAS domain-containing protein, partial [Actinobacteria bacterium]|nr:PAS domain-containing protein [Actinomycetota bacterium]